MPHGSLPPCGGGTGRGGGDKVPSAKIILRADQTRKATRTVFVRVALETGIMPVVPPSLSLPRKGGGNAVAQLCPISSQHSRICSTMCACRSKAGKLHPKHKQYFSLSVNDVCVMRGVFTYVCTRLCLQCTAREARTWESQSCTGSPSSLRCSLPAARLLPRTGWNTPTPTILSRSRFQPSPESSLRPIRPLTAARSRHALIPWRWTAACSR